MSLSVHAQFQLGIPTGQKAKDFTQADTSGIPVSFSQFKGKYVLLDFWASWCEPCRWENKNLVRIYNEFKDKGLNVISVSLDNNKADWIKAIKTDSLVWTHVSDLKYWNNEVAKLYNVSALPYNFLINPDGVIIGQLLKGVKLENKLSEIFGK